MKKLTLIFASIIMYFTVSAQNTPPEVSAKLDKFVGNWIYKKNKKEVQIILQKVEVPVPAYKNTTTTMIEGHYIYIVNNKTIDNSVDRNLFSLTSGYIEERDKPNKLKISWFDFIKKKSCDAILIILPGDPTKMQMTLQNKEGLRFHKPGEPEFDKTFTLPEFMILDKQQ